MTMTRESDYAVRIMRALSHGSLKTVKEICGEEAIPTQFAYKILKKLSPPLMGWTGILHGKKVLEIYMRVCWKKTPMRRSPAQGSILRPVC